MATTVDTLLVEIRAETAQLRKGLNKVNKQLDKTKKSSGAAMNALKGFGSIVATIGLGKLASDTVNTIRTFEDLEATLRAITGGAEGAAVSFEVIREFTKGTTFQIDEVADSFINLLRAGVVPTSEVLKDFGNLAAGSGKSIQQLSQAAFNATTGEMEMLKQFGVIAKLEGDKVNVTFQNVSKSIDRNGDSIIAYLRSIGRENFSTAIEERLNTLSGAISNLGDASSEFMVAIGEGGLKDSLTKLSKEFTRVLGEAEPFGEFIGSVLGGAFTVLGKAILIVIENMKLLLSIMLGLTAAGIAAGISRLTGTFATLNKIIKTTFATTSGLLALTGPAGWKAIAMAVGVATASYVALDRATQGSNKTSKDKVSLDKELNEKVKVTKDIVKQLTVANKDLVSSFKSLNQETEVTLNSIVENTLGLTGAKDKIEEMYATFRDEQLKTIKQLKANDPDDDFFRITGQLRAEDMPDFDAFRDDFYKKVFGMSGSEVDSLLKIAIIAPVEDIKEQLSQVITQDDDPFKELRAAYKDDSAVKALYDEQIALGNFTGTLVDFQQAIFDFLKINDTELTAVEETLKSIFEAGAKGDLEVATTAVENNSAALQTLYDKLMLVDTEFAKLGLTFDQFKSQYDEGVANMSESTEELGASFVDVLAPAIQSMSLQFTTSFVDALAEGQDALGAFKDFAGNIVKQIIATFLQMAVVNKILNGIFGVSGFNVEGYKPLPTLAGGGAIQGKQPTLVGERGPEIFVPNTGGTIMNNMNSKNAMGGGNPVNIYQTVNFATGIVPTVRAEVTKMMPQIADVTKAAVQESAMRGGSFRRSLVGG